MFKKSIDETRIIIKKKKNESETGGNLCALPRNLFVVNLQYAHIFMVSHCAQGNDELPEAATNVT